MTDIVGVLSVMVVIAGILMPLGYVLQTYKIIRNRSTKNVAVGTYIVLNAGFLTWLLYGIAIHNVPIISANIIAMLCSGSTIVAYMIYKK